MPGLPFVVLFILLLLSLGMAGYYYRTGRVAKPAGTLAAGRSDDFYRTLIGNAKGMIALMDENLRITFRSVVGEKLTGWTNDELTGLPVDLIHPDAVQEVRAIYAQALKEPGREFPIQFPLLNKQGTYIWLEGTVTNRLQDQAIRGIVTNLQDVTARKEAEDKLLKLNRLYLVISKMNQLIVRAPDVRTLFEGACRIAVEAGGMRMAWVGVSDELRQELTPAAHAGEENGYLAVIRIPPAEGLPESKGPPGLACHSGQYHICNDIAADPEMAPWRDAALVRNYRSSIALPLMQTGKVTAVLSLYSEKPYFFDSDEIALLKAVAADISFALERYEHDELRKHMEEELEQSRRSYQTLTESSPVGIFRTDATGYTTYVNPQWCRITGLESWQGLGNGWLEAVHPADREAVAKEWEHARAAGGVSDYVYRFVRPDGRIAWVLGSAVPEEGLQGEAVGYVGTITDITDRKIAEHEIARAYEEKEAALNRISDAVVALDNDWRYTFRNEAALSMNPLGEERLGKSIWDLNPLLKGSIFWDKYHEAMQLRKTVEFETYYEPLKAWLSVRVYPSEDGLTIYYKNVTERKTAEFQLKEKEERYRAEQVLAQHEIINERNLSDSIISSLPGICYLVTRDGQNLRWNSNFEAVSSYREEEIRRMHPGDFFEEPDSTIVAKAIEEVFRLGESDVQAELRTKSGKKVPYYFTGKAVEYQGRECMLGVGIDFTERVEAQEKIRAATEQLRELAAHLQNIREEERADIARDIHDDLGQQLTAVKIALYRVAKQLTDEEVLNDIGLIIEMVGKGIESMRRISTELRPGILDDLGLVEAMNWQVEEFRKRFSIPIRTRFTGVLEEIEPKVAINLFRIFQETLTNIARHSGATKVEVRYEADTARCCLEITDNGRGLNPHEIKAKRTLGLLGMQERAHMIGGKFTIEGIPGEGTRVRIEAPIRTKIVADADTDSR